MISDSNDILHIFLFMARRLLFTFVIITTVRFERSFSRQDVITQSSPLLLYDEGIQYLILGRPIYVFPSHQTLCKYLASTDHNQEIHFNFLAVFAK